MKSILFFITVLTFAISNSQEPPAYFMFNYKNIADNSEELLSKYDILSYCNRGSSEPIEYFANIINKDNPHLNHYFLLDEYIRFEIGGYIPNKNEIAVLVLKEKKTNKYFNLHIRFCALLDYGEIVFLENLAFSSGNFFYDTCNSKKKYEIECLGNETFFSLQNFIEDNNDFHGKYKIDLEDTKLHEISKKKLNRITKKYVCKI